MKMLIICLWTVGLILGAVLMHWGDELGAIKTYASMAMCFAGMACLLILEGRE